MTSPLDVLSHYWGYDSFRECQAEIIDSVLAGHDTIGLMPTGGGKSVTFQVPALLMPGITLVVTPLISLMKDQVDNLRERGIRAGCLHSGLTAAERRVTQQRIELGKIKILYLAPEKLARKEFVAELRSWNVSLVVIDEAHCISQWGYDFRPSYLDIAVLRREFPHVPMLALTASATPAVVADIAAKLQMRSPAIFSRSFARPNISYIVRRTDDKDAKLLQVLGATRGSAIVYVRSRRRTAEIAQMLQQHGISADFYHAGIDPELKTERQDAWKTGRTRVIVATNAFGMGIDKPDVRTVVHYDLPPTLEEYYQEAGRGGRDGLESFAVMLVSSRDKATLHRRLSEEFPGREYLLTVYEKLGNFLNVAVGGGYDRVYECNLIAFCKTFNIPARPTLAALRILTRAGAIEFGEEPASRSRVMITIPRSDFYSIELDELTDRILRAMLRSYTGLFADFVAIDEVHLAYSSQSTPQQVYDAMLLLSRMHVLSYVPRRTVPFVYYPTARDLPKHVVIPRSVYEDRLAQATARMKAIENYAFSADGCRVARMLRYFGDESAAPCGKCDVCRDQKNRENAAARTAALAARIPQVVTALGGRITLSQIHDTFGDRAPEVINFLRDATDRGLYCLKGEEFVML